MHHWSHEPNRLARARARARGRVRRLIAGGSKCVTAVGGRPIRRRVERVCVRLWRCVRIGVCLCVGVGVCICVCVYVCVCLSRCVCVCGSVCRRDPHKRRAQRGPKSTQYRRRGQGRRRKQSMDEERARTAPLRGGAAQGGYPSVYTLASRPPAAAAVPPLTPVPAPPTTRTRTYLPPRLSDGARV